MVKKKPPSLADEFEGGLLPGLNGSGNEQQSSKGAPLAQAISSSAARKKVTLYLDPQHVDRMDDLLTALKRYGLPRDNSMLIRAMLDLATGTLTDSTRLEELARACERTMPNR